MSIKIKCGMDLCQEVVEQLGLGQWVRKVTIEADVREAAVVTVERYIPDGLHVPSLERYELRRIEPEAEPS